MIIFTQLSLSHINTFHEPFYLYNDPQPISLFTPFHPCQSRCIITILNLSFLNMFVPRHFAVTKTGGFGLDQKTSGVFIMSIHMFFFQNDVWLVHDTPGWTIAWKKIQVISDLSVYIIGFLVNCGTTIYTINPRMCRPERFHLPIIH